MRKRRLLIISIIILAATVIALVSACAPTVGEVPVSAVTLENTEISLNTVTGNAYNTHQLYPIIYPDNASNKRVVFYFADSYDTRYVDLSPSGLITAKAEKRDDAEKIRKIEIIVASAENSDIKTSVFVTVENVAAKEVYFEPAEVGVNLASKPFKAEPRFIPAHASVDTDITFTTNDPTVATVDADGTVRPIGHGTTTIVASAYGTNTLPGYLQVKVRYAPPQYSLNYDSADEHAFKQSPGDRRKISFILMPYGNSVQNESGVTLSDSNPSIVWRVGGAEVSPVPNTKAERFDFIPEENVTAGVYYVTVNIKDADDQEITLTSPPISIFKALSAILVSSDVSELTVGDSALIRASHRQDEFPPDSYKWYYYKLTAQDEEAISSGSYEGNYDYVSRRKQKPSAMGNGDYTLVGGASSATLDFRPTTDGEYFFLAVPVENGVAKYSLAAGLSRAVSVEPSAGSLITGLDLTYNYTDRAFLPKLVWQEGFGDVDYSVEVLYGEGDKKTFTSDFNAELFDGSSFVFPETGVDFDKEFRIRVRANDFYGWSEPIIFSPTAFDAALRLDADVKKYYSDLEGLPFDAVMDDPTDTGEILNFIRVMQPTSEIKSEAGNTVIEPVGERRWRITALYEYTTVHHEWMGETLETRKVVYANGTEDATSFNSILLDTAVRTSDGREPDPKVFDFIQTLKLSFSTYIDTAACGWSIMSDYRSYAGGLYTITYEMTLSAADGEINAEQLDPSVRLDAALEKYDGRGENYLAVRGTLPANFEFFKGRGKTIEVETSDELYYAAVLGLKPIPVAGSHAESVYEAAKNVLRGIVSATATDRETVIAVYDWLAMNVCYDRAAANDDYDVSYYDTASHLEGVFGIGTPMGKRLVVCSGYAKAFALMLNMMNIPCLKVSGTSNNVGHAWNKFFIEGKWYLADPTWGASGSVSINGVSGEIIDYSFLFATDEEFAKNHITNGYYPPTGTSNDLLYYRTAGTLVDSAESLAAFVRTVKKVAESLNNGEKIVLNCWFDTDYLTAEQKGVSQIIEEIGNECGVTLSAEVWQHGNARRIIVTK